MKTNTTGRMLLFAVIVLLSCIFNTTYAQDRFLKEGINPSNTLRENLINPGTDIGIGVGTPSPHARLHVLYDGGLKVDQPVFLAEAPLVSVSLLEIHNSTLYGLLQRGNGLSNKFEGKLGVGKDPLYALDVAGSFGCTENIYFSNPTPAIGMSSTNTIFNFEFPLDPLIGFHVPLSVRSSGIKVDSLVECETFQMHKGAGDGKVLVSNPDGFGEWKDITSSGMDDDWLVSFPHGDGNLKNLYLNPDYQKVGLGTADPMQLLHVCGGNILISKPIDEAPGSLNGSIYFGGEVTSEYPNGEWGIEYVNDVSSGSKGLNFWKVNTNSGPSGNYRLFLRNDGNVGIGTDVTHDYKLAVAGNVLCEELKVKLVADWPDYIFDKNHSLPSLQDVDRYITEHKHLPDVPSSQEVKENGINVGEMNVVLLKKVEELTLYVIAMQKEMEQLKAQINNK